MKSQLFVISMLLLATDVQSVQKNKYGTQKQYVKQQDWFDESTSAIDAETEQAIVTASVADLPYLIDPNEEEKKKESGLMQKGGQFSGIQRRRKQQLIQQNPKQKLVNIQGWLDGPPSAAVDDEIEQAIVTADVAGLPYIVDPNETDKKYEQGKLQTGGSFNGVQRRRKQQLIQQNPKQKLVSQQDWFDEPDPSGAAQDEIEQAIVAASVAKRPYLVDPDEEDKKGEQGQLQTDKSFNGVQRRKRQQFIQENPKQKLVSQQNWLDGPPGAAADDEIEQAIVAADVSKRPYIIDPQAELKRKDKEMRLQIAINKQRKQQQQLMQLRQMQQLLAGEKPQARYHHQIRHQPHVGSLVRMHSRPHE